MQDTPAVSAAKELKAAARDALRVGSKWAHTAILWVDERRAEMNNRNRELEGRERERAQRDRYSTSGYGGDEGDAGPGQPGFRRQGTDQQDQDASQLSGGRRRYSGREQSGEGRGDRDIQGRYSQGDYGGGRRGFMGAAHESQQGYGREGGDPQSQSMSHDDSIQRDEMSTYGQSTGGRPWQSGMHGSSGQASQYRDSPSHASEQTDYPGHVDRGGFSREGYGAQQYARQSYGSGADPNQARTTGLSGQGYGGQDFSGRASYGPQGGVQGWPAPSTGRPASMGHRGKGPKNYSRSDERIREDLSERLTDSDEIDASGISVEVNNGIATLTGTVGQRWMKHLAEDLAESCSGVRDVTNQISVESQWSGQGMSGKIQSQPGHKMSSDSVQGNPGTGSGGDSPLGAGSDVASGTSSSGTAGASSTGSGGAGRPRSPGSVTS